jgi:hypothetical protein
LVTFQVAPLPLSIRATFSASARAIPVAVVVGAAVRDIVSQSAEIAVIVVVFVLAPL